MAAAAVAILLVTLGGDALADPARSGATAQPGGDRFAGVASAKEKQSAGKPGAKKKGDKPRAKKKGAKKGTKKKGAKKGGKNKGEKKGGKKKGGKKKGGKPGARGRPTDPHTLFYKAEITGAFRYQQTWDSGGSDTRSASLPGGRASVRLSRDEITNPMTGRTAYFYDVDVIGGGELSGASRTDSSPPNGNCSGRTVSDVELAPAPISLSIGMLVGLPGAKPSISGLRLGPVSSVTRTDSGFTCTLPNGETIQMIEPSTTSIEGTAGVPLGCNKGPSASEVTATEGGAVVWGRPSTIVVTCRLSPTGREQRSGMWVLGLTNPYGKSRLSR